MDNRCIDKSRRDAYIEIYANFHHILLKIEVEF